MKTAMKNPKMIPKTIPSEKDGTKRLKRMFIFLDTPENRKEVNRRKKALKTRFTEVEHKYYPPKKTAFIPRVIVIYRSTEKIKDKAMIGATAYTFAPEVHRLLLQEQVDEALNLELAEFSGIFSVLINDIQDARGVYERILRRNDLNDLVKAFALVKGVEGTEGIFALSNRIVSLLKESLILKKKLSVKNVLLLDVVDYFLKELSASVESFSKVIGREIEKNIQNKEIRDNLKKAIKTLATLKREDIEKEKMKLITELQRTFSKEQGKER